MEHGTLYDERALWLSKASRIALGILMALFAGFVIAKGGISIGAILVVLPPLVIYVMIAFNKPALLMHSLVVMGFLFSPLSRYLPGNIPFGLSIDALLILTVVVLIFRKGQGYVGKYTTNLLSLILLIWLFFSIAEIANPLARSKMAWFYANRGLSFYPLLICVLSMYVFSSKKQLNIFLVIWACLEVFGTLWGIKQLFLGVSATEQAWLNAGAASTHILFGKLRVFSYFSDAAQFGASQAHTALVFGIIGIFPGKIKYRWLYLIVAGLSLYGMLASGTRGALGVLALGGFTYFIMTKNFRIVVLGIIVGASVFVFLKYTTIMQSNYQVNRMRTALRSDDPSMMVRKKREKILAGFMADKPIGGGIGSAGYWGKRFSPGTFLAEIGTDGHYTRIWMETGIVGLWLYLLMLIVIVFYLGRRLWVMTNSPLRQKLVAFYCGFLGLCLASYTNGLLTQIPTGILVFVGLAFVYLGTEGKLESE
ncbi:MAG: O-antigen ligase family protein [Marinoscillum sp.]